MVPGAGGMGGEIQGSEEEGGRGGTVQRKRGGGVYGGKASEPGASIDGGEGSVGHRGAGGDTD